jgi:hypothetical protein
MKSAWNIAHTSFSDPVSIVLLLSSKAADTVGPRQGQPCAPTGTERALTDSKTRQRQNYPA